MSHIPDEEPAVPETPDDAETTISLPGDVDEFRSVANRGNTEAQYMLFRFYVTLGEDYDYEEAMRWLHKAALSGHEQAQAETGVYLLEDYFKPEQRPEMLTALQAAVARGNALAQYGLGRLHSDGKGKIVPQSFTLAEALHHKAATQDLPEAMMELARFYKNGQDGIAKDQQRYEEMVYKAEKLGYGWAITEARAIADKKVTLPKGMFGGKGE